MTHWKKLAVGLIMAGAASPVVVPSRADDADPSTAPPAQATDEDQEAQPGEEQNQKADAGHIIIVTPDGKQQRIELPLMPRMGKGPRGTRWLNNLSLPGGPEQEAAPPKYVIGVGVTEVPPVVWAQLKRDGQSGVAVAKVMEDTPAATAGLKENDIILKANDKPIQHQKNLTDVVQEAVDKPIQLLVLRAGEELTIEVTPKENEVVNVEARAFIRDDLPPQLLNYGVHSFGPGVVLQGDPGHIAKIEKELEHLRARLEEINTKLDQLNAK